MTSPTRVIFGSKLLNAALGFIASVVIARALLPEGRAEYFLTSTLVVGAFAPAVSGNVLVKPQAPGVKQEPPLPVEVELARDAARDESLAVAIRDRLREVLVVQTRVELVPWGALRRSEYKSRLVERH